MNNRTIIAGFLIALGLTAGFASWRLIREPENTSQAAIPPVSTHDQAQAPADPQGLRLEVLQSAHDNLFLVDSIPLGPDVNTLEIADQTYVVNTRWANTQPKPIVLNDAPAPMCAVDLAWGSEPDDHIWVQQTRTDDLTAVIDDLNIHVRVLPAGEAWLSPQEIANDITKAAYFVHDGQRYDLTEIGQEVFEGWTVRSIQRFEHALRDDQGQLYEDADKDFPNPALKINIEHADGTVEQHICFMKYPTLTQGAHPQVIPVTRLSGQGVSQSRLTARAKPPNIPHLRVVISAPSPDAVDVVVIPIDGEPQRLHLEGGLPYTIPVGDTQLRIIDHRTHARMTAEYHEAPSSEDPTQDHPTWVISPANNPESILFLPQGVRIPHDTAKGPVFLRLMTGPAS